MVRRKKKKKTTTRRRAAGGADALPGADLKIGGVPDTTDPKAHAEYFIEMLNALAQQGTPETKRIREALIDAIKIYEAEAEENKEAAGSLLRLRVMGMEFGLYELYGKSVRKIRDKFVQDARKMGTSQAGILARSLAEGLTLSVDGIQKILDAIDRKDETLRDEGQALLQQSKEKLAALGM